MKDVVAYCRVACAKQSDPSAEAQRQERTVRRYADARGLVICETYLDAGVSGATLERPALQSLLGDCRAGKIGTVITQDPERSSRKPTQFDRDVRELSGRRRRCGVQHIVVKLSPGLRQKGDGG